MTRGTAPTSGDTATGRLWWRSRPGGRVAALSALLDVATLALRHAAGRRGAVGGPPPHIGVVSTLLKEVRAGTAEPIVPRSGAEGGVRLRLSGHGHLVEDPHRDVAAGAWWAGAAAGRPVLFQHDTAITHRSDETADRMAVPVPVGDGVTAVLLVTDSLPDIAPPCSQLEGRRDAVFSSRHADGPRVARR